MPDTQITNNPVLGTPAPPGGTTPTMPAGQRAYNVQAQADREYVAGGYYYPLGNYVRTLPEWTDPNEREFGLDVYQRMVNDDPQVASCIEIYKTSVLADGWHVTPNKDVIDITGLVDAPDKAQPIKMTSSTEALEAADYCRDCLSGMQVTPFELWLRQMLDATYQGYKVSEIVLKLAVSGRWAGDYVLDRLKPKPHRSTAFVMDSYDNMVGLLGLMPNVPIFGMWPQYGFLGGDGVSVLPMADGGDLQKAAPSLLPRKKFAILTFDGIDGDPRGRSLLRRAFTPYYWKANLYAIWGKFAHKHSDPSLVGTAAGDSIGMVPAINADGSAMLDSQGNPVMLTSVENLGLQLARFENGSYIAIPNGADVKALDVTNKGEAIDLFFDTCDRQIAKAILGQTLATEEGKHASRAQASVHGESKDDVTRYGQVLVSCMVRNDILALLIESKYGPGNEHLIPHFALGQEETVDFAAAITAAAGAGYTFHTSQFPGLDEKFGAPARDIAAWQADMEAGKQAAQAALTQPGTAPGTGAKPDKPPVAD